MENIIEKLETIVKEIKSWEHDPRPDTIEKLHVLSNQMHDVIFG